MARERESPIILFKVFARPLIENSLQNSRPSGSDRRRRSLCGRNDAGPTSRSDAGELQNGAGLGSPRNWRRLKEAALHQVRQCLSDCHPQIMRRRRSLFLRPIAGRSAEVVLQQSAVLSKTCTTTPPCRTGKRLRGRRGGCFGKRQRNSYTTIAGHVG